MNAWAKTLCRSFALSILLCCGAAASAQLKAKFTATPLAGCSPLVVQFTDQSTGAPTQWRWDLGNGVISLLKNPSTTYFNAGTYTVKLVVKNATGSDSISKVAYISVNANPSVAFRASDSVGCFPLAVSFTNLSTAGSGTIVNYQWDFGDGVTSTLTNPSHTYTSAGNFNVTLRVNNSNGCTKTFSKMQYIKIADGVKASFTEVIPSLCSVPVNVQFTNTTTGPGPLQYSWQFGDGGLSAVTNPGHTYNAAGSYTVTLAAVSPQGCRDTVVKTNLISIGTPSSNFTSPDSICVGTNFSLQNTTTPFPTNVVWSFGDGTTSVAAAPVKNYTTPGVYTIKLLNFFGTCSDSVSKQITVLDKPTAAFTASGTSFCKVPAQVQFTSQSTNAASYLWSFGDGASSTQQDPQHTYTTTGNYSVTLVVTNASGCSDTITHPAYIMVQTPQITIGGLPRTGCTPLTINPVPTIVSSQAIAGYLWDFGDGTTSAVANPSHTYTVTGNYTVKLIITTVGGCSDSVVMTNAVRVGEKPHAGFTITPHDACAFQSISFSDAGTTGGADQWFWTFGDGGTSTQQNPIYQYSDTGYFNVQLIVFNNTCPDTLRINRAVHIRPPIANFTVRKDCGNKYLKVFTDKSIGALSWFWTFGDGTTSTLPSPTHIYPAPGIYMVTLTVANDTCSNSKSSNIRVVDEHAGFTTPDTLLCKGGTANFTAVNMNVSNVATWKWSFGDGTSAVTPSNASHQYLISGTYMVTLMITDALGCVDSISKPITVFGPTAFFHPNSPAACIGNNLTTFFDSSVSDGTHGIVKWVWSYGDGAMDSSGIAPYRHSYAAAGTYAVSLTVQDSYGCTNTQSQPSAVVIADPKAGFFSPDTATCTSSNVTFTNTSTGSGLHYVWQFGDGGTDVVMSPSYVYTAVGTYDVSLLVSDQYGCKDSVRHPAYINVSFPKAAFTASDTFSTCPPLFVSFINHSLNYTSIVWDFGDGASSALDSPSHFYTVSGTYYATLTATGPGGCTNVMRQKIQINGPRGTFSYAPLAGCKPLTVNFVAHAKNTTSFIWDFSDGSTLATIDSVVSHIYVNSGDFVPKLILIDSGGCTVAVTGPDTIHVTGIRAGFTLDQARLCSIGNVTFTNSTVGNDYINNYLWNFGDGGTSNVQNPVHTYNTPGLYTVQLNVTSQYGCMDSARLVDTIFVFPNPVVRIVGDSIACAPANFVYTGAVSGVAPITAWNWNMGNGQTSALQNPPPQTYPLAGSYTVTASVTDANQCSNTATKPVMVNPVPALDAGPDAWICRGAFATLNATGASAYTWQAQPSLSCTNCASPLAAPTDSVRYFVTGKNVFGCTGFDSVTVRVHQPFVMQVGPGDTICLGEVVQLRASGADQYSWTPAASVNNPTSGNAIASPIVSTTYTLIAKDNAACFADTAKVFVKVWPMPTVNAGPDEMLAITNSVTLKPTYSTDVSSRLWSNAASLSCSTCAIPVATPLANTTYRVQVTNAGGCTAADEVTIFVVCNNGNLFIPNTFSPNNDGKNDRFYPRGSGTSRVRTLRVFNRWGEVVYERQNFNVNDAAAGWDGLFKGQPLVPDVYVYTCDVVCMNNELLSYKGDVMLVR